ncbi:teichoic acid transport system ATP-binding protein [Arthrobacter stackebrandtii]|uniref:Teichoic acid transport system ATP-binding protein n=1 Tax=Arthrobacter stackebrandtii TaxID=272161 RepID=A0ABS4Z1A7_9MICC|nr:ATP-binding cassette domain-containing protein [Arthrobacter stackebrandtii]MBP2414043.1 teichoic acid transport system ATP-binding protein [Arthrobacter stackebrandtii]
MSGDSTVPGVLADPCVVAENVAMKYKVISTEEQAKTPSLGWKFLRRIKPNPNTVTVNALNELSLIVRRGESVGVIGRNGSGKSTLMKLVSGQVRPTSGAIHATSTPIMLGVNAALVPELAGDQNVILGGLAMGLTMEEIEARFDEIVEVSGLEKSIHLPMKSYSSGMGARLRFAIAACGNPEILLVDEALNTGDAQFAARSKRRMDELREKAGCVLLVSHSLTTIKDMTGRVVWLDKGDLIMDGEPKEVTKKYMEFTKLLAKGNNNSAFELRAELRSSLEMVNVVNAPESSRSAQVVR